MKGAFVAVTARLGTRSVAWPLAMSWDIILFVYEFST